MYLVLGEHKHQGSENKLIFLQLDFKKHGLELCLFPFSLHVLGSKHFHTISKVILDK